jgi:hypothetical protein
MDAMRKAPTLPGFVRLAFFSRRDFLARLDAQTGAAQTLTSRAFPAVAACRQQALSLG